MPPIVDLSVYDSPVPSRSSRHRPEIEASELCGCYYCLRTFPPRLIVEWTDRDMDRPEGLDNPGQTPLCPHCGIDSVIGSAGGDAITEELLKRLHERWFA